MKKLVYFLAVALFTVSLSACGADKPSQADMDGAIKALPLDSLNIYKKEMSGKDGNGVYTMAAWGLAKDDGTDMNVYLLMQFQKKDGRWESSVPVDGIVEQPVSEKDKDAFYDSTAKDWQKLKGWIARSSSRS